MPSQISCYSEEKPEGWQYNTTTAPPKAGSGSGSGAMTTAQDAQNQPVNSAISQAGSGSGSGATTTVQEGRSKHGGKPLTSLGSSGSVGSSGSLGSSGSSGSGITPQVSFSAGSYGVAEPSCSGSGTVSLEVDLSAASSQTVTVQYQTSDGTAMAGTDYTAETGTLTFQPGQVSQNITVAILDDGSSDDNLSSEAFSVALRTPNGAILGTPSTASVNIMEGSGTGQDIWQPVSGGDYLWSDPVNWSAQLVPTNGMNAVFDGNYNSNCIVDVATSESSLILQNGFTAPFEIQGGGAALNIYAYADTNNVGGGFNVNFLAANAPVNYDGLVVTEGKDVNFGTGGKVNILNGSSVTFGVTAGKTQESESPINVSNGQLIFGDGSNSGDYNTFKLTTASADINIGVNGKLNLFQTGKTLIDSAGNGAVISNNGTATMQGVAGAEFSTIGVPLQNHSTLNVNGGIWSFVRKDASGYELFMDAGSINLNQNADITIADNYKQTGGVFNVLDSNETFKALLGFVNFNGGTVKFTNSTGFGTLNSENIHFTGAALNMRIAGGSNSSDVIKCTGCTIESSSNLNVTMSGPDQSQQDPWTLINVTTNQNINGDFNQPVNLPPGVIEGHRPKRPIPALNWVDK